MPDAGRSARCEIAFSEEESGSVRVDLLLEGRSVSRLWVVPFRIRIGAAVARMDGIAGVSSDQAWRNRGYSRQVLEAAVASMRSRDAALSMLYGIPDFYPKFGYATAGPDQHLALDTAQPPAPLPDGWRVRRFAAHDMEPVQALYQQYTVDRVGIAMRTSPRGAWSRLASTSLPSSQDECRVVIDPTGKIAAYAWRSTGCWYRDDVAHDHPEALVLGEVIANDAVSADAVLIACRRWADDEAQVRDTSVERVLTGMTREGPVAAAAMRQGGRFEQRYAACGESMVRLLNVRRLFEAMQPELDARLATTRAIAHGRWRIVTEIGFAVIAIDDNRLTLLPDDAPHGQSTLYLPQADLARLALGAFPPQDVVERLDAPIAAECRVLLEALFPLRQPHMHLPDRF